MNNRYKIYNSCKQRLKGAISSFGLLREAQLEVYGCVNECVYDFPIDSVYDGIHYITYEDNWK